MNAEETLNEIFKNAADSVALVRREVELDYKKTDLDLAIRHFVSAIDELFSLAEEEDDKKPLLDLAAGLDAQIDKLTDKRRACVKEQEKVRAELDAIYKQRDEIFRNA